MSDVKGEISTAIKRKMLCNRLSLRKLADHIESISYTQVHRITRQDNYNIDTLEKILDALDLEIRIVDKTSKKKQEG